MPKSSVTKLEKLSNTLRQDVIKMLVKAGTGHPAAALGLADIFTVLYFEILKHNPKKPAWENRDRLCLSCGHACPILYAALARSGYFPLAKLNTLRKFGSQLQGHPSLTDLPGVENSSGPLGQGASVAVGRALAAKTNKQSHLVYCVTSDGEHNEGQLWEAVMSAAKFGLDNLIFIVDRNNIQIDGFTEDIMPLESLKLKYEAFNWQVFETDGHDIEKLIEVFNLAKKSFGRPKVIIAQTVPGKGVSFMENDWHWHGQAPNSKQGSSALRQLKVK